MILKAYAGGDRLRRPLPRHVRFAIAERDTGRLMLARDRLGIKPLYLDQTAERLRFASTLPALLAAGGADTSIDQSALAHYMTFHSRGAGAADHPQRHAQAAAGDGADRRARRPQPRSLYWDPEFTRDPGRADWTEQDWQEALIESLRTAVDRRMVADVPVGVLLSGGIDSSLVVALLAEDCGSQAPKKGALP